VGDFGLSGRPKTMDRNVIIHDRVIQQMAYKMIPRLFSSPNMASRKKCSAEEIRYEFLHDVALHYQGTENDV
jgi:hypothetical protein